MTWSYCHTLSDLFDMCTLTWRNNRSLNISSYFDFLRGCSIYFQHNIFARKIGLTTQKHLVFGSSSSKSIEFELFLHIWYQSLKWRCSSAKKGLWMPESKNGDHFLSPTKCRMRHMFHVNITFGQILEKILKIANLRLFFGWFPLVKTQNKKLWC